MAVMSLSPEAYARRWPEGRRNDGARVALESFRPYWEMILRQASRRFRSHEDMDKQWHGCAQGYSLTGKFDVNGFCVWATITKSEYETLARQMRGKASVQTLDLGLCDRVMTAAGLEDQVSMLYVVDSKGLALAA